jgi:hypothetical protein
MKHLKTPQELNEASENLNISDVRDSFDKGQFYTKHYKDGSKMIFKYKGKSSVIDMVRVYMFCGKEVDFEDDDIDDIEYCEDIEVFIGNTGTSEGSYLEKSTKEDIDFLTSVSQNYL